MAIFLSCILIKPTTHALKTVFEVDMILYPMACSRNNCKLKCYFSALTQVHLGLLEKNENKSEEMLHILQHCSNEYVPVDSQSNICHKIPFGGDHLTVERAIGAANAVADPDSPYERQEGLIFKHEEFHCEMNFLQVKFAHFILLCIMDPVN